MKNIYFVTSGNDKIGHGHLFRCVSLMNMLSDDFSCHLLLIDSQNVPQTKSYLNFNNLYEVIEYFKKKADHHEIAVLDAYDISNEFVAELKKLELSTVTINDIPEDCLNTDVVINHTIDLDANRFSLPSNVKLLLGEKYLLLRDSFLEEKLKISIKERKEQIFICFGGTDPFGLSMKTLQVLSQIGLDNKIIVATNSKETEQELISFKEEEQLKNLTICRGLNELELIGIIKESRLAIVPSSTIALECMCVGVNLLTGYIVANQRLLAENISKLGLGSNIGNLENIEKIDFEYYLNKAINANFVSQQKKTFQSDTRKNIIEAFNNL